MNTKKQYNPPVAELCRFEAQDVITASGAAPVPNMINTFINDGSLDG